MLKLLGTNPPLAGHSSKMHCLQRTLQKPGLDHCGLSREEMKKQLPPFLPKALKLKVAKKRLPPGLRSQAVTGYYYLTDINTQTITLC